MPLESVIRLLKKIIPHQLISLARPAYHWLWALGSALYYRFPARNIDVVMITGTKGKTTTAEAVNTVLEAGGYKTALASTLRFKIGKHQIRNTYKMSVPGRGVMQEFVRSAVAADCDIVIMEMTSQAVLDHRHQFLFPNVLVFTNIEPEHIEAHGSFAAYLEAKLQLADALKQSLKKNKAIISNLDDEHGRQFIARSFTTQVVDRSYSLERQVTDLTLNQGISFTYRHQQYQSPLQGEHNAKNILAAIKVAEFYDVEPTEIATGVEKLSLVRGRLEHIGQGDYLGIAIYIDYAHTPESLRAVYRTFPQAKIIGVLGNTGGGRDTWKRPSMAKIAEQFCDHIVLTDEDPYDEDPRQIVDQMYEAIENKDKVVINLDRRAAIAQAITHAVSTKQAHPKAEVVVLITGKGTDPYIMRAHDLKEAWDDATVVREVLTEL